MRTLIHKRGFTLAELLVVMAILAILVAIIMPMLTPALSDAEDAVCLENRTNLARECAYAIMLEPLSEEPAARQKIFDDIMAHRTGRLCPKGGVYSLSTYRTGGVPVNSGVRYENSVWKALVTCTEHSTGWARGQTYQVGDIMTSNGFVFECLNAHTTGTSSRTRDPSVKSNKVSWQVIGTVDNKFVPFTTTVRYAIGYRVSYGGGIYERTAFNLTGAQDPNITPPQSSKYWIYIGDDPDDLTTATPP